MTVDINDVAISCVNNHVTAAIAHDIKHVTSTFDSHFRHTDVDHALIVVTNLRL